MFIEDLVEHYISAIFNKWESLGECVGLIDGTFIGIYQPGNSEVKKAVHNGHKKRALKFQKVTAPDGLILHLHAAGPIEG